MMTPACFGQHARNDGVGAVIGAVQVAVDLAPPAGGVGAGESRMARTAGVIDQNVDRPQGAGQRSERASDLIRLADVGDGVREGSGDRHQVGRNVFHARLLIDRGDLRALVDEVTAEALADAARGAGDGDHLVLECHAMPRRNRHPFNAPSISPLKNSLWANVNAIMPGVTTMT